MQLFPLVLLFGLFLTTAGFCYLSPQKWKIIRRKLLDVKTNQEDKQEIKKLIYNKYKYRTYIKAKEFKLLNKHMTKNTSMEELGYFALVGLAHSINNFNPKSPINFAKFSDKYIEKNLIKGTKNALFKSNSNNITKWYIPYWSCLDNGLSPLAIKIFHLKFSKDFTKIKSNKAIASELDLPESKINETLVDSIGFITKSIDSYNDFANKQFLNKILN